MAGNVLNLDLLESWVVADVANRKQLRSIVEMKQGLDKFKMWTRSRKKERAQVD